MKRAVTIILALALLAVLYWRIDAGRMVGVLAGADLRWLGAGLALFVPLVLLAAARLRELVPGSVGITLGEAVRLNLAASVLNLVLPSKMGDLAKSWFFRQRGHLPGTLALALVIFERTCDMLALLAWCSFGLLLVARRESRYGWLAAAVVVGILAGLALLMLRGPAARCLGLAERLAPARLRGRIAGMAESWETMHGFFWSQPSRLARVAVLSLAIWFVNLFQVWVLIGSLGARVPVLDSLGLTPIGILAGLLPVTFGGVGTRDVALVFLYRDHLAAPAAAALGLLLTARYAVLAAAGLPFLGAATRRRPSGGWTVSR